MLMLFLALVLLLLASLAIGIEFLSVIAYIGIIALIIYFLIKFILGFYNVLTVGTLDELEKHEPSGAPVEAIQESIEITSEKLSDIAAKSQSHYRMGQSDWRKNTSNAFNNLIKGFFKLFK